MSHAHPLISQVRFELAWKALDQTTKTIIPWRIPEFYERFASVPLPAPLFLGDTNVQTAGVKHSWTLLSQRALL